jgi:WD40 repeat protein
MNLRFWQICLLCHVAFALQLNVVCAAPLDDFRKWKDKSGKFEIDAKYVKVSGDKVSLETRAGKIVEVPLDRLSPVDQGFIEAKMSSGSSDSDSPFKEIDPNEPPKKSEPATGKSTAGAPAIKQWTVDWEAATETSIENGNWNPQIGEQPTDFKIKTTSLPGKAQFFEGIADSTFNAVAKRAVLTFHISPPGDPRKTRMVLIDTETGKVIANAIGDDSWVALAIHDDGEHVVVRNDKEGKEGQLGTVKLAGKIIKPVDTWTPYAATSEVDKKNVVKFARFINNGRLLTLSHDGRAVIWDFATRTAQRRFKFHHENWPALTVDRKHFGIAGGDILAFINLDDENAAPSVRQAPGMGIWANSCFSPSCKRFAAVNLNKMMIWDVASGDVVFEGAIPGLPFNGRLMFPDEEFVIINNDKLIEISSGIKLWHYQGYCQWVNGKMIMVANEDKGGKIMEVQMPHATARDVLKQAKRQSDLFVLQKGSSISIDLSGVPQQYQGDVEQSLKKLIQNKGFKYSSSAKVSLKPAIKGPTREAVSYSFAGNFAMNKYGSTIEIMYEGKSIWSGGYGSNVPGFVSRDSREDVQKQLDEAGQSPNLAFYNQIVLPDFLQKPSNSTQPGSPASQMIGHSKFTSNGLVD